MTHARALVVICAIALLHAMLFIAYQHPDWSRAWTDQGGYHQLAVGILKSGTFTRYPGAERFVPEVIRTPGYPLFVAVIYRLFGESHMAVAIAQAVLFAILCLVVSRIGCGVADREAALLAAALTALYSPFPYFGALIMTELWTTLTMAIAMLCYLHALRSRSWAWSAAAGFTMAVTALSRPVFILLPLFAAGIAALLSLRDRSAQPLTRWMVIALVFGATVTPWFAYNWRYFHRITLSAAGGIGRPIWESTWQGRWSGRIQASLTDLADSSRSDTELDAAVADLARRSNEDTEPMRRYVHQWRTIRKIWTTPTDPDERSVARAEADDEYARVGVENIKRDPVGHFFRRATRGLFVLWAADVPIRYTDINATPAAVIRTIWLVQVALILLATVGFARLIQRGDLVALCVLALPVVYITAVHFLLLTEARQSMPAKPLLLTAAGIAIRHWWIARAPRSLALKSQLHEI